MKLQERILHMLLFQISSGAFGIFLTIFFTGYSLIDTSAALAAGAVIAMSWNGVYNYLFDKVFGEDRISRGVLLRIMHAITYEAGLLSLLCPSYALILKISLSQALLVNIAVSLYFVTFSFLFNWGYDIVRHRLKLVLPNLRGFRF